MKTGTVKTLKQTAVLLELGIDFQANDLNDECPKGIKKEILEEIIRKNFNNLGYPRIANYGWFDKETKTYRCTVEEDLFI